MTPGATGARHVVAILAGLLLCACAGMGPADNERFRALVTTRVTPGMPLAAAEYHLGKLGFACDENSAAPDVSCERLKDNILLYSCIQRVDLAMDADGKTVAVVTPQPIRCAGL